MVRSVWFTLPATPAHLSASSLGSLQGTANSPHNQHQSKQLRAWVEAPRLGSEVSNYHSDAGIRGPEVNRDCNWLLHLTCYVHGTPVWRQIGGTRWQARMPAGRVAGCHHDTGLETLNFLAASDLVWHRAIPRPFGGSQATSMSLCGLVAVALVDPGPWGVP